MGNREKNYFSVDYCPRNVQDPKILHGDNKLIRDYKISE